MGIRWKPFSSSLWLMGSAALVFLAAAAPVARADKIDEGLLNHASQILEACRKAGYQNVGVLKFEVQVGKNPPSMRVGRFNSLMATRLENALIIKTDSRNPILVTRGASARAAQKDPQATYATAEGRSKLFEHTYPMAWGNLDEFKKVDAFLTGLVQVNYATLKSVVTIKLFDRKNPSQVREVVTFQVPIDRQVLADVGLTVSVVRRNTVINSNVVECITETPIRTDPKTNTPRNKPVTVGSRGPTSSVEDLLDFKVYYNGQMVPWSEGKVAQPPQEGQKVHFTVRATRKIGLVLRVNGITTWGYLKDRPLDECPMWVLEPGQEYTIAGYYPDKDTLLPFRVVAGKKVDSELAENPKLGLIEIDTFFEQDETPGINLSSTERSVNLRSVSSRAVTLPQLKQKFMMVRTKDFLDADSANKQGANVNIVQFRRGVPGPRFTIQYEVKSNNR